MDNETKHDLLNEIARWLEENGLLFVVRKHGYVEGWRRYSSFGRGCSPRFLIRIDPDNMKLFLHQPGTTSRTGRIMMFDLHDPETFPTILEIAKGSRSI